MHQRNVETIMRHSTDKFTDRSQEQWAKKVEFEARIQDKRDSCCSYQRVRFVRALRGRRQQCGIVKSSNTHHAILRPEYNNRVPFCLEV